MNQSSQVPRLDLPEEEQLPTASVWPCRSCAIILGLCHLWLGITLLIFDVVTNNTSETAFAVTASLSFIVCAILAFIAARRLDRAAQLLLLFFSLVSFAMCLAIFLESTIMINEQCDMKNCYSKKSVVHIALLCISLFEMTATIITIIVCFRSLRRAYGVIKAGSPYSTFITGNYGVLQVKPKLVTDKKKNSSGPVVLEYLLR
ncbi:hypothetical protein AB6A40_010316 [Gnathostoma spinigerum]|uniref:Uncharacterized protein n=1 Tax=Gnathostoma spinigerum TaxID=75299 RepID=A0ABD6EWW2_9BILA